MKKQHLFLIGALVLLVIASPFILQSVQGLGAGSSDLAVTEGCKPKNMNLRVSGNIDVKDKTFFSIEPQPTLGEINVLQVSQNYLGLLKTDYALTVAVVQGTKILGQSGVIEASVWNNAERLVADKNPYTVDMIFPDNNCDGKIDPFNAQLVAKLVPEGQPEQQIVRGLQYTSAGNVVLS